MEHMRRIACETVLRACGFASLAIFCVTIGMSFNPHLAFQAGGFLTTLMALILILKAYPGAHSPSRAGPRPFPL
jgi:predicted Kef-type K+ transport protein